MPAVVDSEINNELDGSDHCPLSLTVDLAKVPRLDGKQPAPPKAIPHPVNPVEGKEEKVDGGKRKSATPLKQKEDPEPEGVVD